jgi:hypothetical protein
VRCAVVSQSLAALRRSGACCTLHACAGSRPPSKAPTAAHSFHIAAASPLPQWAPACSEEATACCRHAASPTIQSFTRQCVACSCHKSDHGTRGSWGGKCVKTLPPGATQALPLQAQAAQLYAQSWWQHVLVVCKERLGQELHFGRSGSLQQTRCQQRPEMAQAVGVRSQLCHSGAGSSRTRLCAMVPGVWHRAGRPRWSRAYAGNG